MRTRFRKYYQPGLITLSMLPIMCCIYFGYKCVVKREYAIQFQAPPYRQLGSAKFPPIRNYQKIALTGEKTSDSVKLQQLETSIKNLILKKDRINGICVHIDTGITFQTFVTLLDICNFDQASIYGQSEDDFYIAPYAKEHETYTPPVVCGNTRMHDLHF